MGLARPYFYYTIAGKGYIIHRLEDYHCGGSTVWGKRRIFEGTNRLRGYLYELMKSNSFHEITFVSENGYFALYFQNQFSWPLTSKTYL